MWHPSAGGGASKAEQGVSISAFTGIIFHPLPLFICLNGAAGGILTGFLLANLSSVHKALGMTIEIVLLSVLSSVLFGTKLGLIGAASVLIVASGTFMYSGYTWSDLLHLIQGQGSPGSHSKAPPPASEDEKGSLVSPKDVELSAV